MRGFLLSLFISIAIACNAQFNLVPNGSFEDVPNCTQFSYNIYAAPPWINANEFGTSDLFNYCNMSSIDYMNSIQIPHTGVSYAGFFTGEQYTNMPNIFDAMEYIEAELIDTLGFDRYYYVEYYLSLAEWGRYATNNVGVYFSDTAIFRSGIGHEFMLLDYPEQILPFGNPVILDTADNYWYKVQGVYLASGNEKFITIGNFNSDNATTYINYLTAPINQNGIGDDAYYFIDDISVTPLDSIAGGLPANAGPDQTIYIQDSVFVGQRIANLNCNWYELGGSQIASNTSGLYVQPLQTTTYVVEQILGPDISYDTCTVFVEGLGLEENELVSFEVYPNPSNGTIIIEASKLYNVPFTITITDLIGNVVYQNNHHFAKTLLSIDLDLSNGSYLLNIPSVNNHLFQERLVVIK
jgi:hypothetical protein